MSQRMEKQNGGHTVFTRRDQCRATIFKTICISLPPCMAAVVGASITGTNVARHFNHSFHNKEKPLPHSGKWKNTMCALHYFSSMNVPITIIKTK